MVFLVHPGPSLLVTALFVATAGLALHRVPDGSLSLRLAALMLPIQFAIGITNDLCDAREDALSKPYKPLVRDQAAARAALAVGVLLAAGGLAAAASISGVTLGFTAAGLVAGLLYDVGLRRTPLSFVPWCVAFCALPLAAFAAAGRSLPELPALVTLAMLLALGLHFANALPDIIDDRRGGRVSLPVLLGPRASAIALIVCVVAAAVCSVTVLRPATLSVALNAAAAFAAACAVASVTLCLRRPFPLVAVGVALLAVAWLAQISG